MAKTFLDKTGLDALWGLIKTAVNTLVEMVGGKVNKGGDTMEGDLDMNNNTLDNCHTINMSGGGEIDMNDSGISNCKYIEGSGDNDTIEMQSKIDATGYGFWNGERGGTAKDIILGNGKFIDIADSTDTGSGIFINDEKILTSKAIYNYVEERLLTTNLYYITYSGLKTLRDGGKLRAGQWYRITDFVTTCNYTYAQSAGHAFDILVFATSTSTLSETAFAARHSDDTYFSSSKLDAWELRYCLDNDRTRFMWANTSTGKGVIYYMKDEFGNSAPYDFKNIQFCVRFVSEANNTPANVYKAVGNDGSTKNINLLTALSSTYYYTFSTLSGTDASLTGAACNNRIAPYMSGKYAYLNFIVLKSAKTNNVVFGAGCRNIGIECYNSLTDTTFCSACQYIYIRCKSFYDNSFGSEVTNISILGNYSSSGSSNIWANHWGHQCSYIALVLQSHVRCLNFMSRNQNICLYGSSAQCIQFGEEACDISWIEQATFAAGKANATFTKTPAYNATTGYFVWCRFMAECDYISIGIPFFIGNDFQFVRYVYMNMLSSATYAFSTPTHWLLVRSGDYGTSSSYQQLSPTNNSASAVILQKRNVTTLNY